MTPNSVSSEPAAGQLFNTRFSSEHKLVEIDNRIAVEDLLRSDVYFNDTNDSYGIASVFTPDAIFQTGRHAFLEGRDAIRAFAAELATHAGHGGRQHYFQPVRIVRTLRGHAVRSYWIILLQ
jgi:uncharacterized protein (TIGR02246 family)